MLGIWSVKRRPVAVALEPDRAAPPPYRRTTFEKKHGMRTLQPGEEAEYAYTVFEI